MTDVTRSNMLAIVFNIARAVYQLALSVRTLSFFSPSGVDDPLSN